MILDATHLSIIDGMTRQLQDLLIHYNREAEGITDKIPLLELRRKQFEDLREILRQQIRGIDYHLGKPITPEVHNIEAHLVGVGFGEMM